MAQRPLPARHQVLVEWNDTRTSRRIGTSFLDGFATYCLNTPDALAVVDGRRQLTYEQLDRRSSYLALALRRRGIGPEAPVGLHLERGLDTAVAALGILKAGGIYVPLDPTYPKARLQSMVADASASYILTHGPRIAGVPARKVLDLDLLCLDGMDESGRSERPRALAAAYVIYTSGSTGRPRGVTISHQALAWYCAAAADHYALRPGDRLLQLASISFDISVGEIFPCLFAGATLIFPPSDEPGADVFTRCREQAITVLFPPTALWHELAELAEVAPETVPKTLRLVSFGGERVLPARLDAWRRGVGDRIRLLNGYGPTETTVEATLCDLTAEATDAESIGRPVADTRAYVLNREALPVTAADTRGELAIAGTGLARGYHRAGADTASRFIPDPFTSQPGERLYLTGDQVRWRPDGRLEILGRLDQQVKIRGFRVEPAETEAVLGGHPAVRNAVVVASSPQRKILPGDALLSAFVVANGSLEANFRADAASGTGILGVGERPGVDAEILSAPALSTMLRDFLRGQLPAHMVPTNIVVLDELPLSPNGKVDRVALARRAQAQPPAAASADRRRPYAAPNGAIELTLTRIWQRTLRVDRVGAEDDFFELGGDSILSIQISTQAFREGLRFSPQAVFEYPTVARLASVVTMTPARAAGDAEGPVAGPAPLTPVQCWFLHEAERPEPNHFNQSMMLEVHQPLDLSVFEHTAQHLLFQHDALRARFERSETGWRQVFTAFNQIQHGRAAVAAAVDLSHLPGGAAQRALTRAAADLQASLDIEQGPMIRCIYFDLGSRIRRLLIPVHHLVMDAVSWGILLSDLERIYRRLESRRATELPARATSYKTWAELQAGHAHSAALRQESRFWATLPNADAPLPRDVEGGVNSVESTRTVSVALDSRATRRLLREVPAAYRTRIDDILLAALARTLMPWAGAQRVDLESHGREEIAAGIDLSRTIGWFTSTFPVVLDLTGVRGPGEALITVKETLRSIPRGGIGYGILRYLKRGSRLGIPAEMSFNYLGQLDALLADSKLFTAARESRGTEMSRRGMRSYVLEIDGGVVSGRLWINCHFSRNLHRRSTIEGLAATFKRELEALIDHCLSPGAGGVTPSDFPLAGLERGQLNDLADRDVEDIYPLSPMQQGMLFHCLYAPDSAVYFEQSSWAIRGDLDAAALRRAWDRLTARHAILRTSFAWQGLDRPLQIVHRNAQVPFRTLDWRERATDGPAGLEALLREDRSRCFDLDRAPLMRLILVRLGDQDWRLVWSVHHLLLDGWSIAALFDELFDVYQARLKQAPSGGDPPAPRRRRLFRDYIAWLEARDASRDEAFWRRALAGFSAPPALPDSSQRTEDAAASEVTLTRRVIGKHRTAALGAFARGRRLTLATLLRGAWGLVLGRSSGARDVVFGATVSGRPASLEDADSIVGLLINTLPVRVRLEPGRSLLPWLDELQAASLELQRYEHTPLVEIQRWSDVSPHQTLFDSLLVFENYPTEVALEAEQERGGLKIGGFVGYSQTNYPLTLGILPGVELTLEASVDPRRLEPTAAMRLLHDLDVVLRSMARDPHRPLAALDVLTAAERHQLLTEWNDTDNEAIEQTSSVHRLFEAQVERSPDAVALIVPSRSLACHQLTYGELNRRANRLARVFKEHGVGPESRVGLALDRSAELVTAILAVLKAGGAYLPLDPIHPVERLQGMLERSRATLLVTRGRRLEVPIRVDLDHLEAAAHHHGCHNLPERLENHTSIRTTEVYRARVARVSPRDGRRSQKPYVAALNSSSRATLTLVVGATSQNKANRVRERSELSSDSSCDVSRRRLAYVLHTSGSTGAPKGVMVSHGALLDTLDAWRRAYRLRNIAQVHLQAADFTFDVATGDLLRAFGTGAALLLCPRGLLLEPREAVALIRRTRVDCAELVPAIADLLARQLESTETVLEHMRLLAVGSDTWRMMDLQRLARVAGQHTRIVSSYGVTEATIDSSFFDPKHGVPDDTVPDDGVPDDGVPDETVPLGRPFALTRLYVTDRRLAPAGVGVSGELVLGGAGLARGYIGRPATTAERFVPDPFPGSRPGARLYHTGDRVRHLADGNVEFLGRVDHQVKIRGIRIEPGEVEIALRQHPALAEAVAVAYEDSAAERALAAFVVPIPGATAPTPRELRAFLEHQLPEPMIPSLFEIRDALPLNGNGKVDRVAISRAATSRAATSRAATGQAFKPPITATEQALAEIWTRILGSSHVGRRDDFFVLGGHSLRAVALMVEIERRFEVRLPLASLFRQSMLADLARRIDTLDPPTAPRDRVLVEIGRVSSAPKKPPFYCAHPVGGHVLCYAGLARHLGDEQPFIGLQRPPDLPSARPFTDDAIGAMAQRYLEAIRDQRPEGPYFLGGWSMGGVLAFEIARRLREAGEEVGALVLIDCAAPGSPSALEVEHTTSLEGFAQDLGIHANGGPPLGELTATEALASILTAGRHQGLLSKDLDLADFKLLYQLFEHNDQALKLYRPRPYNGRLTLLRSSEWQGEEPLGWNQVASQIDVRRVAGDHYSMVREPHVQGLAAALREALAQATG